MEQSALDLRDGEEVKPYKIHVSIIPTAWRSGARRPVRNSETLKSKKELTTLPQLQVSSKYLELTKKKLELTRLPHELLVPRAREWEYGTPKSEIEPLVDFW